jgi:hypothetical protein
MMRNLLAASAILLGTTFGAAALPAASPVPGVAAETPVVQVKNWKHGHGHGWGHHRKRHYGWDRGRHRGWYKHHRRHRGWGGHHRRHGYY